MKRLLSLLLTCAFLLGALTACGGGKTESQTASSSEPASASTAAASAEPASAAAEPTVAELEPFTASEDFPYPYSEELERDETTGQYLLTLEQALYDYDTMWMLIRDNFADLDAACEAYGLDWQRLWQDGVCVCRRKGHGRAIRERNQQQGGRVPPCRSSVCDEFILP